MIHDGREWTQEVRLKVVTPLFLGNAGKKEGEIPSELRPPSIKGALRFWHRAAGPDNLKTEAEYFGSTKGQSSFLLQIGSKELPKLDVRKEPWQNGPGYLGYGLINKIDRKIRPRQYIQPGEILTLRLVFHPDSSRELKESVLRSFRLLSLFGGLGARSRRGFGSVIGNDVEFESIEQLKRCIKSELEAGSHLNEGNLPYTAFSNQTRVLLLRGDPSWEKTLQKVGEIYKTFRSFQVKSLRRKYQAQSDNLLLKKAPSWSAFGLPHKELSVVVPGSTKQITRRASPLFIHIHQLTTEECIAVVGFFPSLFLPKGTSLTAYGNNSSDLEVPDWSAIEKFFNLLKNDYGALEV
jgi:CRISPR-associated protein Cmr1